MKVYGFCDDKCRMEVIPKDDTGWINAEQYVNTAGGITKPVDFESEGLLNVQIRKINNVAYIRGVLSGVDSAEKTLMSLPDAYKPTASHYYFGRVTQMDGVVRIALMKVNRSGKVVVIKHLDDKGFDADLNNYFIETSYVID